MKLLAIETSCDETAVAVLDLAAFLNSSPTDCLLCDLVSSQIKLHEPYGGVVPELAAREHIINLPLLVKQALAQAQLDIGDIRGVAVTQGPGLKGCLLVGLSFAKALCYARRIPLYPVNHLEGHLLATFLLGSAQRAVFPLVALLVSGGHTMIVHARNFREYQIVARTRDDAAGEAFDKTATLLGLPYPGGPALAALARRGSRTRFIFPQALPGDQASFSFSGLKTAVLRIVATLQRQNAVIDDQTRCDLAACAEEAIVQALVGKTVHACRRLGPQSVTVSGGVAANERLRQVLSQALEPLGIPCLAPPLRWCTDNASMIALAAAFEIRRNFAAFADWPAVAHPGLLGPDAPHNVSAQSRMTLAGL